MSNSNGYRYPGSRPFEDTYLDRRLFFGREREKRELLYKVLAKRLVVLYAKSGLGKTSLINAGVNELLRENGCVPLKIRFNDAEMEPLQAVFEGIKKTVNQHNLDYEQGEEKTLWQYFKTAAFWSFEDTLLTPVLILDQFEEFFAFHSSENRKKFISQLADLVNGTIPLGLRQSMGKDKTFPYSENPPNVKILISIREDSLGQLDEFAEEIPDILHNRFRLTALTRDQAREAIKEPSQVKDDRIGAAVFKYEPEAVDSMLDFLCKQRKRKDFVTKDVIEDEVEPFQLQLLCQHIEREVRRKADKCDSDIVVKKHDLGDEAAMRKVLQSFYDGQLKKLGAIKERRRVRKLFEKGKGLISTTGRRLKLDEEFIGSEFKVSDLILSQLVNSRLLRSEKDERGVYYELSHDALVDPIRESQQRKKVKKYVFCGTTIVVCILIGITIPYLIPKSTGQRLNEYEEFIEDTEIEYRNTLKADNKNVKAYLELGALYYRTNRFEDSIKVYKEAIKNGVKDATIFTELGKTLMLTGKTEDAIRNFNESIKFESENAEAYEGLGEVYEKQKKYKLAIENFEKAIEINAKRPGDVYRKLAVVYAGKGKPGKAIEVYQRALKVNAAYAYIYIAIAKILKRKGERQKYWIEKLYDIASKVESKKCVYYAILGLNYYNLKIYDKSIENYKKALEIKPDYATAYNNMGFAFRNQKKYKEAIENFKKALKIKPNLEVAYIGMGSVLLNMGKYNEAIENFKKALKIKPDLEEAYKNMGLALTKQGKYDEAIENYGKALRINPENANVCNNIGYILIKQGKYDEAIENLKKALKIKPDFAYPYKNMGIIFYYKKKFDGAIENYKKALEIDSELIPAKANLAKVYLITDHLNKASKLAKVVLKERKASIRHILEMRFISITTLLLQGKKPEVLDHLKKFIKYYRSMTGVPEQGWIYSNIKNFISLNIKLKGCDRTLLFKMIDILESPKAEGDKRLKELEEFLEIYE